MSLEKLELFTYEVADESSFTVQHDLDVDYPGDVRLLVDGQARTDLFKKVTPNKADPRNALDVVLTEDTTGRLQLLGKDFVRIGQATAEEAATSLVFGQNDTQASSPAAASTTSGTTWRTKAAIVYTVQESGKHRIGWSYLWSASSAANGRFFNGRVLIDGETVLYLHKERAKQKNSATPASFFKYPVLAAGEHTIELQFKRESNQSMEVTMADAELEIWRTNSG